MPVEALIFDLGGVLVLKDMEEVRSALVKQNRDREYLPWDDPNWIEQREYELGHLTTKEFLRHIQDRTGQKIEEEDFRNLWKPIFHLNEPLVRLIPKLSGLYPLVLLSNVSEVHWAVCEEQYRTLFSYFSEFILSFQVGLLKPNREIFLAAANATGRPVEKCLMVDDSEKFVNAARTCGLHALLYTGLETVHRLNLLIE